MAALAPFLDLGGVLERVRSSERPAIDPPAETADPAGIERQLAEQNLLLAGSAEIPDSVRYFVDGLADELAQMPREATARIDPYLLVAVQGSLIAALRALDDPDAARARRELRVRLEQLRQVYRNLADSRPIYEDRPAGELVRWLTAVLDVPHARLAELFGVSPRTWQRWLSRTDPSEPAGREAQRARVIAALVGHLRHALTGPGALEWLERPHPAIGGRAPAELLDEPDALAQLARLAAAARGAIAA